MPQLRKDPVTGRWVIVDTEHPKRASDYPHEPHEKSSRLCPFCPGNEAMTPSEIAAYGRRGGPANSSGWLVRVIPNKFPALRIEESADKSAIGLYDKIGGFGAHEVIIDSPDHQKEMAELPVEHVELVLRAYRDRCLDLKKDPRFRYILIFKNYGASAGASLEHPHSQLIALPVVPSRVTGESKGAHKHFDHTDRCIYCDMLDQEHGQKKLTVIESPGFTALSAFAARFPFETWILPRQHSACFEDISDAGLMDLAAMLKETLGRIRRALGDPSFNFMIHTTPMHAREEDSYHWHIEIIPKLTQVAGFEQATGFYVNPTPPELAAETLRDLTSR